MIRKAIVCLMLLSVATASGADSIFDIHGSGKDVVPVAGLTRALGGATLAGSDPLSCAISNPFASALADRVTLTAGIAHVTTRTDNLGKEESTINTLFPTLTAIIPYKKVAFMTGLYLEKEGRLGLAFSDSAYGDPYDFSYRREVSAHSVPLYVSAGLHRRFLASVGILFSALDIRETHRLDFAASGRMDTDDAIDISASGQALVGGFLVALGPIRAAALFRGKMDLDGALERENRYADVWQTEDVELKAESSYKLGARLTPHRDIAFEVDYEKSPWSGVEIDGESIAGSTVYRWSVGAEYRGDILWDAAKYPLLAGYYRQPLDWDSPLTGEIIEQVFSAGTSIPIAEGRAAIALAVEIGQREAQDLTAAAEIFYGLSISVSAIEAWRREVRRSP